MTGHVIAPEADPGGLPATLSRYFMTDVLRGELGFEGIIVTDAMNMRAITARYGPDEAAVMAIEAGVDMILAPADFHKAAEGILKAVGEGVLSEERIVESVRRILRTKSAAGLVEIPYL
jgi:beta-N-acetylhexosaminidase